MRHSYLLVLTVLSALNPTSATFLGRDYKFHRTFGGHPPGKPGNCYADLQNDPFNVHSSVIYNPISHVDISSTDFTDPRTIEDRVGIAPRLFKKLEVDGKKLTVGEVTRGQQIIYSGRNDEFNDGRSGNYMGGHDRKTISNNATPPRHDYTQTVMLSLSILPLLAWIASTRFLAKDIPLERLPRLLLQSLFPIVSSFPVRFLFTILAVNSTAQAYPIRTHIKWAILLCKLSDSPQPVHDVAYFKDMYLNRGTGGLADYWHDVSYGNIDLAGSVVSGWHTISPTVIPEKVKERGDWLNHCVDAARNDPSNPFTVPSGFRTLVITSPAIDEWGGEGAAFLYETIDVTGAAHETGHGIGMTHSFSDDPNYLNINWAQIGEYDDKWDLMSAANVFTTKTDRFGSAPPGLNGFGLDRAGWLPIARTYTFGQDGASSATVTIAALNHPEVKGNLLVRVPFDPSDLLHYYTIELRSADGLDAGIPGTGGVMLHEIKLNPEPTDHVYKSYLLREHTGNRDPLTSLNRNGVTIKVNWVNVANHQASVTITGDIAGRCLQGYVWREAFPGDHVCVTPSVRSQASFDNSIASSRSGLLPDSCKIGYFWRQARPSDHVCVAVSTWIQTKWDNTFATSRRNPSRFVFGPTTCANGYVWREADNTDHVCVTPDIRTQAKADNAAAASRQNPRGGAFGPDTCLNGYVWREAFLGDYVCVAPSTRARAAADNNAASSRVAHA